MDTLSCKKVDEIKCWWQYLAPDRGNLVIVQEAKEILLQRYKDKAEAESALESQVQKLSEDVTQIKNMFEEIKAALTKLPTNA